MWTIKAIPAFTDNYIWLLQNQAHKQVAVVDPGDAAPVLAYLSQHGLQLNAILITHHHSDHTGGIAALTHTYPTAKVYAPAKEQIIGTNIALNGGDAIILDGLGLTFQILDLSGHTRGHIGYYHAEQGNLFCGDTLFAGGCGRVFEGTMAQMQSALANIRALPDDTQIYCAHEYTEDNLAFARWVEPNNAALIARQQQVSALRAQNLPSVPCLLALEKQSNPFLRYDVPTVINAAETHAGKALNNAAAVFGELRQWKDKEFD